MVLYTIRKLRNLHNGTKTKEIELQPLKFKIAHEYFISLCMGFNPLKDSLACGDLRETLIHMSLHFELQNPGLFDGCSFFLTGHFTFPAPSKEELGTLIQLSDGKVLLREPQATALETAAQPWPFHASEQCKYSQYVVCGSGQDNSWATRLKHKSPLIAVVSATWILDSLSHFKLLSICS